MKVSVRISMNVSEWMKIKYVGQEGCLMFFAKIGHLMLSKVPLCPLLSAVFFVCLFCIVSIRLLSACSMNFPCLKPDCLPLQDTILWTEYDGSLFYIFHLIYCENDNILNQEYDSFSFHFQIKTIFFSLGAGIMMQVISKTGGHLDENIFNIGQHKYYIKKYSLKHLKTTE